MQSNWLLTVWYLLNTDKSLNFVVEFTKSAVELEIVTQDDVFHAHASPFRGEPRPELDQAWMGLLKGAMRIVMLYAVDALSCWYEYYATGYNTRVPAPGWQGPSQPNRSLVELNDGSGDLMATPYYLHEIHCLVSDSRAKTSYCADILTEIATGIPSSRALSWDVGEL